MGLYLCVFDGDDEVEGVEVGSYSDFNVFRDAVTATVENGQPATVCPVLISHSDCDGVWTRDEAKTLLAELSHAEGVMRRYPPVEINSPWKKEIAGMFGIKPETLADSFFDVDGEPLIERLKQLAQKSVEVGQPILFQ
ncbi:MAG TPA: Imm70 family immunity protein [Ramlibacter sp.]|uniref:Imm70 family immunity protein n=1 Tax=Ramlibacter sp. TaxID=1917967 RepID=UPI002ED4B0E3